MKSLSIKIAVIIFSTGLVFGLNPGSLSAAQHKHGGDMQSVCPVLGNPVDMNVFTEFEGTKIYFCCDDCISKFKKNPDLYLKNLNQTK